MLTAVRSYVLCIWRRVLVGILSGLGTLCWGDIREGIGQACMGQETSFTPGHVMSKPCFRLKHTEMEDTDLHYISEGNQPASTLKRTRPPQYSGH